MTDAVYQTAPLRTTILLFTLRRQQKTRPRKSACSSFTWKSSLKKRRRRKRRRRKRRRRRRRRRRSCLIRWVSPFRLRVTCRAEPEVRLFSRWKHLHRAGRFRYSPPAPDVRLAATLLRFTFFSRFSFLFDLERLFFFSFPSLCVFFLCVVAAFCTPMTSSISDWIWSESFWLPENVTWADLEQPPPGVEYPRIRHLLYALPLAGIVFLLRLLFERLVARPCALMLHIQAGVPRQAQPNAVLEKVFQSKASPDTRQLEGLCKQLDWDERKVQRWFRVRRNQDRPGVQKKFCESMWRLTFYLGIFIYGVRHLWASPWTWDTRQCWHNYPFQHQSSEQFIHYAAELSFYWSLMFSQFIDVRRKDFVIMLVHHLATIFLITASYANNMLRAGSLVMCVHDASDVFLEAAKMANYAKYQRLCDGLFVVFSVSFFITRLVIYPFWVVHTVLVESWELVGPYRSWWLLNGMLLVLQALHVIWFYLIARIAIKAVFKGKVAKDERSDIESSSDEEIYSSRASGQSLKPTGSANGGAHDR